MTYMLNLMLEAIWRFETVEKGIKYGGIQSKILLQIGFVSLSS